MTAYFTWAGTLPFFHLFPRTYRKYSRGNYGSELIDDLFGIFPAAIAYVTWATALSMGETGSVASMLYGEPVVAIIVAWLWLQEFPSLLAIIGGFIAISSVIIVNWISLKRRPRLKRELTSGA